MRELRQERGDDDIEKNFQKVIPDGWIGSFLVDAPFNSPPNRLNDCETFVEFKALASLSPWLRMNSCPQSDLQPEHQPEARAGNEPACFCVTFHEPWGFFILLVL